MKSHLNAKTRADGLILDNWPKDINDTGKYFSKMEKNLNKEFAKYYNRFSPSMVKSNTQKDGDEMQYNALQSHPRYNDTNKPKHKKKRRNKNVDLIIQKVEAKAIALVEAEEQAKLEDEKGKMISTFIYYFD